MKPFLSTQRILAAAAVFAACSATQDAAAQSAEQRSQWAADCARLGGRLNYNTGTCEGATGNSDSGGGYTAEQQAMLNLAGQFGSMLGTAIRQSFEQSARQAEVNRIQRAWEAEQARARAVAAAEEQRRRNQALLANMRGAVAAPELTLRNVETAGGLQMRTTEEMFDGPNSPPPSRTTPAPSREDEQAWAAYLAALQPRNEAERAFAEASVDLGAANDIVRAAELAIQQQSARVAAAAPGSEARRAAEAELAEMRRGLAEATRLRDRAERRVAAASAASEQAERQLDAASAVTQIAVTPLPEPHTDTSVVDLREPPARQLVFEPNTNRVYYTDGAADGVQQLALPRIEEVEHSAGREPWLRGMNAVADHDWQTAEEAFREAQARDPSNRALARAVSLAEWQRSVAPQQTGASSAVVAPSESDLALLFDTPPLIAQAPADADLALLFDQTNQSIGDLYQTYTMERVAREAPGEVGTAARRAHANDLAGQALARLGSRDPIALVEAVALLDAAAREAPDVPNYAAARDTLRRTSAYIEDRNIAGSSRLEPARREGPTN